MLKNTMKLLIIMLIGCYIVIDGTRAIITYASINNIANGIYSLYKVENDTADAIKEAKQELGKIGYDDSDIKFDRNKMTISYKYKDLILSCIGITPQVNIIKK